MSKEVLLIAEAIANEKEVSKEIVLEAIEAALAAATRKRYGVEWQVRVSIDRKTGDYQAFRQWNVVPDEVEPLENQLTLTEAKIRKSTAKVGDVIEEPIESIAFGRIAAQAAKQVIAQKVREAKRALVLDAYKQKVGELVSGIARKIVREGVFVELGNNATAFLPRAEMILRENFRVGDRVRAYLYAVDPEAKGPQIFLTRTRPEMLKELLAIEVPEISEEIITIKAIARDPGIRAKVAVQAHDHRIDPIGACIGMRGRRIQAVTNELNGERIDVILWDENPAQLVINAMAPVEVASIIVDEESHTMDIAVKQEVLSQAIGKNGQNVRLASELTGWNINVMSLEESQSKQEKELNQITDRFSQQLGVSKEIARLLAQEGFTDVEEIAYVPQQELLAIEGFDVSLVEDLRQRAQEALLFQELAAGEEMDGTTSTSYLLTIEGMTNELADQLVQHGITSQESLAELSVDDLLEIIDISEEEAAQLIMAAREPWFAKK